MKTTKRLIAMAAALTLTACAAAPITMMNVGAASITMKEGSDTSQGTFVAYKILNASVSGTNYTYSLNSKYESIVKSVTNKTTEEEVLAYIQGLDVAGMRTFADSVYKAIRDASTAITADGTSASGVFNNVEQGYYLIAETAKDSAEKTFSLVMVNTVGDATNIDVTTKKEAPSFQKKIKDKNDSKSLTNDGSTNDVWQDSADYDGGDDVSFQLTATLPNDFDKYDHYTLNFYDNLEDSVFEYKDGSAKVYLEKADGTRKEITGTVVDISTPDTNDSTFVATQTGDKTVNLKVAISDLKATSGLTIADNAVPAAGDKIIVEYDATLNATTAVMGSTGNWNSGYLEYSNNPYNKGDGTTDTTSKTNEDLVVAFTYQVEVNKVDGSTNPLPGATFALYKENASGEYTQVGENIVGTSKSKFNFERLDAGNYKIVEVAPPQGYKKADDISFTVKAEHDATADIPTLTSLKAYSGDKDITVTELSLGKFTSSLDTGKLATMIQNTSGSQLPTTGGTGTKVLYAIGGTILVGAGMVLVSKKRAQK